MMEHTGLGCAYHERSPQWLYLFQSEGVLDVGSLSVGNESVDLSCMLGHRSRLTLVTVPDFSRFDVGRFDPQPDDDLDTLTKKAETLKSLLSDLQDLL